MRVAVLADCHIDRRLPVDGSWRNAEAWKRACRRVAFDIQPDVTVIAGDLFENANPVGEAIRLAGKGLRAMTRGGQSPVVYVLGNHEWIAANGADNHMPASFVFDQINGVKVVAQPEQFRLPNGLLLSGLPWPAPASPVPGHVDHIKRLADQSAAADGPRLAVGHAHVATARGVAPAVGSEREFTVQANEWRVSLSDLHASSDAWPHISLGHIHGRQTLGGRCSYVGSLEAATFADEGQEKGFSLFEWSGGGWDEQFEKVGCVNFATVTVDDINEEDVLEALPAGTIIRVRLGEGQTRADVKSDVLDRLGLLLARCLPAPHASLPKSGAGGHPLEPQNVEQGLLAWAKGRGLTPDQTARLADAAREASNLTVEV